MKIAGKTRQWHVRLPDGDPPPSLNPRPYPPPPVFGLKGFKNRQPKPPMEKDTERSVSSGDSTCDRQGIRWTIASQQFRELRVPYNAAPE